MKSQDILRQLRQKAGLTQEELAQKLFVTRQAVSRWESGETTPNPETLKELSALFQVSINTLLGSPQPVCQCCGMPLEEGILSREPDGTPNEEYCQWCYADGTFTYPSLEPLLDFIVQHMSGDSWTPDQVRAHFSAYLPTLKHWKQGED